MVTPGETGAIFAFEARKVNTFSHYLRQKQNNQMPVYLHFSHCLVSFKKASGNGNTRPTSFNTLLSIDK